MNISIVVSTWKLPIQRLYFTLWQLSHQTESPLEIVVINASPDAAMRFEVAETCGEFPLAHCIDAPQDVPVFNLSRSSNIGIKHSSPQADYIGVVALDLLYSPTVIEALAKIAAPEFVCESPLGSLPGNYLLGDVATLWERWPQVLEALYANPPAYSFSPGAISCIRRDWFFQVHGYDEANFSFSYGDSDLLHRAALSGIGVKIIPWDEAQMIHIAHPARFGIQTAAPDGLDTTLVRNPDKWGEI